MNICGLCGRAYIKGGECSHVHLSAGGMHYRRGVNLRDRYCHDCGVKPGAHHHQYCDMEDCPKCGYQLIGCECFNLAEPDGRTGEQ